jgi:hypothetical protein
MKTPPYDDALKCLKYRKESRSGASYNADGQKFCEEMLKKYPEWYASTQAQIIEETLPYGAKLPTKG